MNLVEFLLARIAEDEAVARAAIDKARPDWVVGCEETGDGENAFWAVEALGEASEWFADLGSGSSDHARAAHIARHDPARILAECEAKRRVVTALGDYRDGFIWASWESSRAEDALFALALAYADHPDFREEWKP